MTPQQAAWLLTHPLDYADGLDLAPYRTHVRQPDGAVLTAILAVDR